MIFQTEVMLLVSFLFHLAKMIDEVGSIINYKSIITSFIGEHKINADDLLSAV